MLPKKSRISRKIFKPLIESRKYFNSEHFSLKIAPATNARVAVSVSKKISKQAVTRNKIRRRVYAVVNDLLPQLSNHLFFLITKPGVDKLKSPVLKEELVTLLKKV